MICSQSIYGLRQYIWDYSYYLLIGGITSLGNQDGILTISVLMCMVTH